MLHAAPAATPWSAWEHAQSAPVQLLSTHSLPVSVPAVYEQLRQSAEFEGSSAVLNAITSATVHLQLPTLGVHFQQASAAAASSLPAATKQASQLALVVVMSRLAPPATTRARSASLMQSWAVGTDAFGGRGGGS